MDLETGENLLTNGGTIQNEAFTVNASFRGGSTIIARKAGIYAIFTAAYNNTYSTVQASVGDTLLSLGGSAASGAVVVYLG